MGGGQDKDRRDGGESGRTSDEDELATVTHWLLHCPFSHTQTHALGLLGYSKQSGPNSPSTPRHNHLNKKKEVGPSVHVKEQPADVAQLLSGKKTGIKRHVATTQQRISKNTKETTTRVYIKVRLLPPCRAPVSQLKNWNSSRCSALPIKRRYVIEKFAAQWGETQNASAPLVGR